MLVGLDDFFQILVIHGALARNPFFLEAFLEHLNLADSRGRPRKAHGDLSDILHGQAIDVLWNQEMQQAWNMKVSLERQGKQPRSHLTKAGTSDDVIR